MYKCINLDSLSFIRKKNEILILNNNNYFYYQTCKGFCNKKIKKDSNFLWINFYQDSENKRKTLSIFKELEMKIINNLVGKKLLNPFYTDNGIGVSIQVFGGNQILDCYIAKDIKMDIEECPDKFYIVPIIWIHNLKLSGDRWYLNIKLLQCIIYPAYQRFNECLVEDLNDDRLYVRKQVTIKNMEKDSLGNKIKISEHPVYGKYFKMLNMGIPLLAVELKLKNELGLEKLGILKYRADELIEIKRVKHKDHKRYSKFFKMIGMGIPKMAIEQKMILEALDPKILDEPDKLIIELDDAKNELSELITKKRLKKTMKSKLDYKINSKIIKKDSKINLDELLEKRLKILNK